MRQNLFFIPLLPPLSHMSSLHISLPLSQELCPCVCLSVFLWHSHTNISHFLFAFASESLPVSSLSSSALHWKETGRSTWFSHSQSCLSIAACPSLCQLFLCNSSSLHLHCVYTPLLNARVFLYIHRWNNDVVINTQSEDTGAGGKIPPLITYSLHTVTNSKTSKDCELWAGQPQWYFSFVVQNIFRITLRYWNFIWSLCGNGSIYR